MVLAGGVCSRRLRWLSALALVSGCVSGAKPCTVDADCSGGRCSSARVCVAVNGVDAGADSLDGGLTVEPTQGPVGTLVTLRGADFSAVSEVSLGVEGVVVRRGATSMSFLVMPGASTGAISLTTPAGEVRTENVFTVTPTPAPSMPLGGKWKASNSVGASSQGISVALSADGRTALVGGSTDATSAGAVWVWVRSSGGWQQGPKLVGTGAMGIEVGQGRSVALSADGTTALIGGNRDRNNAGAAWVWVRDSADVWSQQGERLAPAGLLPETGFGCAVALSADGNTALVGGSGGGTRRGGAWVYVRSAGVWQEQAHLLGTDATAAAAFGAAVALSADGNTALISGVYDDTFRGAAWVWVRQGTTWAQQGAKLVVEGGSGGLGFSVALSSDGNTAAIGAFRDPTNAGAAWVFTRAAGVWSRQGGRLTGATTMPGTHYGSAVALSGDGSVLLLGGHNDAALEGATWVFTRTLGSWAPRGAALVGAGGIASGQGFSVALSTDSTTALIGGHEDALEVGAAWAFIAP